MVYSFWGGLPLYNYVSSHDYWLFEITARDTNNLTSSDDPKEQPMASRIYPDPRLNRKHQSKRISIHI